MENLVENTPEAEDIEAQMKQKTVLRTEYAQLKSQMDASEQSQSQTANVIVDSPVVTEKKSNFKEKLVTFFKPKTSNKGGGSKLDNTDNLKQEAGPSEQPARQVERSVLENELKLAKAHIDDLKLQIESLQTEMTKLLDENRKLFLENEQIRADLTFKQNDVNILSQAHGELDNDLKAKDEELDKLKTEHHTLKGELEFKLKMINQMVNEMDQLQADKAKLVDQCEKLKTNVDERLMELQNDNENLQEELKGTHEELAKIQQQMEQAVLELRHQREKASLEGKISIIHNQNRALMSERVSLESENSSLKRQLEEMLQQTHQTSSDISQIPDIEGEENYDFKKNSFSKQSPDFDDN